jgi:hypothetical protein
LLGVVQVSSRGIGTGYPLCDWNNGAIQGEQVGTWSASGRMRKPLETNSS